MLQEKVIDCKSFEEKLYASVCELGQELYALALRAWDEELHKTRDRSVYRDKGTRKTVLKTLMGEVEYSRHVYSFADENGRNGTVYLLDQAIGRGESGFFSEVLLERICSAVCELPYRKAAEEISVITKQTISHTTVWAVAQKIGLAVDFHETENAAKARSNKGTGELETKLLFEEQDGVWLHLQGKDRKKHGESREMKLAIAYDGAKKTGKNRFELTNKVACANFESVDKFYRRKEGVIGAHYNVDEVELRILNGDGANWIKRSVTDETVHYQLDPFHRNRAIFRAAPDENARKTMLKLLYKNGIEDLLSYIDALANSMEDETSELALRELYAYFSNNKDGLIGYNQRGLDLPQPPEGKEYRHMGAMESNIFSIIGNRMKGRRRCWSVAGGNNLARLLCLKVTGKLHDAVRTCTSVMPEKYADEVITIFSSAKTQKSVGKGWDGFDKAMIPSSQKWIKSIAAIKPFSELRV
jgi:hypothetical protein